MLNIIQGSARQLFQRLQGPMEEDTLRSHFEKMILIGQKYLLRKNQVYSCISISPSNLSSFFAILECESPYFVVVELQFTGLLSACVVYI